MVAPLAPRSALPLAVQAHSSTCSVPVCCPLRPFVESAFLPLQDQPADIRAWVDYHYALGIPRVYLFDNNSTPPLSSALQDHIDDGIVQCELPSHQMSGLYQYVLIQDPKLQAMLSPCPSGLLTVCPFGWRLVAKVCPSHALGGMARAFRLSHGWSPSRPQQLDLTPPDFVPTSCCPCLECQEAAPFWAPTGS